MPTTTKTAMPLPTFDHLCRVYPTLKRLADEAGRFHEDAGPNFCANDVWYGHSRWEPSLRNRVIAIADKAVHRYGSQRLYDIVYGGVYDRLPDCGRCGCFRQEDAA